MPKRWLPPLTAFLLSSAVLAALTWPLPLQLHEATHPSAFGASHAWTGEQLLLALTEGETLHSTARAGYPWERQARLIGWLPLLLTLPLRLLLGPLSSYHLVELLSLPLTALCTWPLVRRWTRAGPWSAAAACVAFALCPFALGTFASGELPKLQLGLLPLFLYALDRARSPAQGWRWALAAAGLALITAFTSPYFGLALPLLAIGLLATVVLRQRLFWRPLACGALVALALLPAWAYYGGAPVVGSQQLHMPAQSIAPHVVLPSPHPVASVQDLLLGPALPADFWEARHVPYLGTPLIVLLGLLALLRRADSRGRLAALALLITGAVLALGTRLYVTEHVVNLHLPGHLFFLLKYPYMKGGMYFRLAMLASLGLALWLAVETARHPRLAWLLLAVQLADALRASRPWPLEVEPVPAFEDLAALRGADGAVLNLPLAGGLVSGQRALLMATVHGRPITALPRSLRPKEMQNVAEFWRAIFKKGRPDQLRNAGIRFVVSDDPYLRDGLPLFPELGDPTTTSGDVRIWDLGAAELRSRPADELGRGPSQPGKHHHRGQLEARPRRGN